MKSPVLLAVFNRPDTTIQVFEAIRKFKVPKLYISADAPREGNIEDAKKCATVRQIVQNVDWDCEAHFRFLDKNVGCGYGISSAISWVFEKEDRAIILEDDCVPAQPFFSYCDYLLEKYKDDERVWLISGRNHNPEFLAFNKYDYIFSRYGHIWGWATWKRCWDEFDINMNDLNLFMEDNGFENSIQDCKQAKFTKHRFQTLKKSNNINSHMWASQFWYTRIKNGGLSIVPSKNLIKNMGIIGTHSNKENKLHKLDKCENYSISREPLFVLPDINFDNIEFRKVIAPPNHLYTRIYRKIKKTLLYHK